MNETAMTEWLAAAQDQLAVQMRETHLYTQPYREPTTAALGDYVAMQESIQDLHRLAHRADSASIGATGHGLTPGSPYAGGHLHDAVETLIATRQERLAATGSRSQGPEWVDAYTQRYSAITEDLVTAHQTMTQGHTPTVEREQHRVLTTTHEMGYAQHPEPVHFQQQPEPIHYNQLPDYGHLHRDNGVQGPSHHRGIER